MSADPVALGRMIRAVRRQRKLTLDALRDKLGFESLSYLSEIERGSMTKSGEPRVVSDLPAALTWDAKRLPGPWVVVRALEVAMKRATGNGICTVAIRRMGRFFQRPPRTAIGSGEVRPRARPPPSR